MADINTTYSGVVEYFDPHGDSGIKNPSTESWFGTGVYNFWLNEMAYWPELEKINRLSQPTIDAVKIPYAANVDRVKWLNERINAINERVAFVSTRTKGLLEQLKNLGDPTYETLTKLFTSALSLVPVIGPAVSSVQSSADASKMLQSFQIQSLIKDYTNDLTQLQLIKTQLVSDLAAQGKTPELTNNAPTAWPIWYYFAIAGVIVLLFFWIKKRKKR